MIAHQIHNSINGKFNLKRKNAPLKQAAGEVETLRHYVDNVVHELVNPLTVVKSRLFLLEQTPERLNDHVQIIESQIDRLEHLVGELRTLSTIDRGKMPLERAELDMNRLVAGVVEGHRPLAARKNQYLDFQSLTTLPPIMADRHKCEQIVVNLVSNALNYTPEGGHVSVLTALETGAIIFSVSDTGMGIAADDLPHIFERFYRTQHAQQADSNGTGLGLAITKKVVELHSGRIDVESAPGQGTTFTVRLPLKLPSRSTQVQ